MIRFGLRLALASGREAVTRLIIITVAVTLGVGLLLSTLAGINAVNSQNARYAWLNTSVEATANPGASTTDPLWWDLTGDYFHGATLGRVDVAATGAASPVPPGIPRLPGPGEFYASPALSTLLASTPADQLGDRFPGRQIGIIGPSALPAPDSLLIVIGHAPADLSSMPGAVQVTGFMSTDPSDCNGCYVGIQDAGIKVILGVVATALLFPVLIFIGTATRLAATRREQRFAAMRLLGATPRQISVISAVESTVAAIAGTVLGFALFYLLRPVLATIPFTGARFFESDIALNPPDILVVAIGIPLGAVVTARLALRRVQISPLGVTRRTTPPPPRWWRIIPLAAGIAELGYFVDRRPPTTNGQINAYLSAFVIILVGLVIAGPWLTMIGSRIMARNANTTSTLIAGRRLSDNPKAGFRAVSGLIIALFVTSVATGVITTYVSGRNAPPAGSAAATSAAKTFFPDELGKGRAAPTADQIPTSLRSIPGVTSVTVVYRNPAGQQVINGIPSEPGVIACTELARDPALGRCPDGATVAGVDPDLITGRDPMAPNRSLWPADPIDLAQLPHLPVISVVVDTDGSAAALERAKTALVVAFPAGRAPQVDAEAQADSSRRFNQWQRLANVVILVSLPIAGCSLAVSVAGGLSDRKRPFSMLRLSGVEMGVLRRVVALESAVPLLTAAVVAIGIGFLAAQMFLTSQIQESLIAPPVTYYAIVAGGLILSLAIIASTLPLLRRMTGPETARNE